MTREDAINALMELFENDDELFADAIEKLDDLTGLLGDERYRPMNEIFDVIDTLTPLEAFHLALDSEDEEGGAFDIMADYFRIDDYGNFLSASERYYTWSWLYESVVEDFIDRADELHLPSEVMSIIDGIDEE